MVNFGLEKNVDSAYNIHYKIAPAIDYIFEEGNPAGIKYIFKKLGICEGYVRLPLVSISNSLALKLDTFIDSFNS